MQLIANRPLTGTGYRADPGEFFDTDPRTAEKLLRKGAASRYYPPMRLEPKAVTVYENKAVVPDENKAESEPRGRGRPSKPTKCHICGDVLPSRQLAREHCK